VATIASVRRAGTRSASSTVTQGEFDIPFDFAEDNSPNADILLPSLRQSGYSLETAIGDLVDNSLDAGAEVIVIWLDRLSDDWIISLADDGSGMDRPTLDQMMRLGSRVDHDLNSDLGRFGLGSTTASLSLGRVQHVVTSQNGDDFWSAATDLDTVISQRGFVKHLKQAVPAEIALFHETFLRAGLSVPSHGSLIRISRCDSVDRVRVDSAAEAVRKFLGRTYRYFINAGRQFVVNEIVVQADDPLWRHHPETSVQLDDSFEYTFPKGHPRDGETESIGIVIVHLPDMGGIDANKRHGMTVDRAGFYVLRNRREIVEGTSFRLFARHNELARFRCELLFPASMDSDLGVTFLKSAWEVHLTQSLRDKVEQISRPYIRQARNLYKKTLKHTDDSVQHDEAAKTISQKALFLRKPPTMIEKRSGPSGGDGSAGQQSTDGARTRKPQPPRDQKSLADRAEFQVRHMGVTAPIYDVEVEGRKLVIAYNADHPFYEHFVLENRDNRTMLTAIDFLIWSLGSAEMLANDEDTYRFISKMREDASFNLRQLLTT